MMSGKLTTTNIIPQPAIAGYNPATGQVFMLQQHPSPFAYYLPRSYTDAAPQALHPQPHHFLQHQLSTHHLSHPHPLALPPPTSIVQPRIQQAQVQATPPPVQPKLQQAQVQATPPQTKDQTNAKLRGIKEKCISHWIDGQLIVETPKPLTDKKLKSNKKKKLHNQQQNSQPIQVQQQQPQTPQLPQQPHQQSSRKQTVQQPQQHQPQLQTNQFNHVPSQQLQLHLHNANVSSPSLHHHQQQQLQQPQQQLQQQPQQLQQQHLQKPQQPQQQKSSQASSKVQTPTQTSQPAQLPQQIQTIQPIQNSSPHTAPSTPSGRQNTPASKSTPKSSNGKTTAMMANSDIKKMRAEMLNWSVADVVEFIERHEDIRQYSSKFAEDEIDGASLLLMIDKHLTVEIYTSRGFKLGPAIKIVDVLSKFKINE